MRRKKGDLSINYIFLIFIATIAVFVIVGMITKWSFSAEKFVNILTGPGDKESEILDMQIVNVTLCGELKTEIVKHAKLCYTKAKEGQVKGTLCYGLVVPSGCGVTPAEVKTELGKSDINSTVSSIGETKILIGYNYKNRVVEIY